MTHTNPSNAEFARTDFGRPTKRSVMRRIRILGQVAKRQGADAATVVGTVLRLWCKADFPSLPKTTLRYSKTLAAEPATVAFVSALRGLAFLDATYWLSSAYAMLVEHGHRKDLAMFFTPASLTEGLLDDLKKQGVDFGRKSFMDPACGGAAFLTPIALHMRAALRARGWTALRSLKHIEKHLHGVDLDETLCELSRWFLCMALYEEIDKTGYLPDFQIARANSLASLASSFGKVDVVVCNPPYRKMSADELKPLRNTYAEVIEAQPNLYCLFIALCVRLLRDGGCAALVTPTSYLSGQYFSQLRKFLIKNASIEHIGMVSERQGIFIDVEQETALTVLRRRSKTQSSVETTSVSVVSGKGRYTDVGECQLPGCGLAWPIPRSIGDVALLRAAAKSAFRLRDYGYKVRIGAYVWNRDKRPAYKTQRAAERGRAKAAMPVLWSSDIVSGRIVRLDLSSAREGEHRFIDVGSRSNCSVVKAPCVVLQRVTSNDQPRRLVAAAVSAEIVDQFGGFVGENHVVIVEAITEKPLIGPSKLAKLLSTTPVDRYFRCISGATNVSVFELNQLALPKPQAVKDALDKGLSLDEAVSRAFSSLQ